MHARLLVIGRVRKLHFDLGGAEHAGAHAERLPPGLLLPARRRRDFFRNVLRKAAFEDASLKRSERGQTACDEVDAGFYNGPCHDGDAFVGWVGEEVAGEEFDGADKAGDDAAVKGYITSVYQFSQN